MEQQKKEFTDFSLSEEHLVPKISYNGAGCFLTRGKACLLVLLAVALAAGVGIAVYFAHPDKGNQPCPTTTTSMPTTTTTPMATSGSPINIRLPGTIMPLHYDVRFRPDIYSNNPADFAFNGTVNMQLRVIKSTRMITLHWRKLNIPTDEIKVIEEGSKKAIPVDYGNIKMLGTPSEFLEIPTLEELVAGKFYWVMISYRGPITNDLKGIYYSSYKNDLNQDVYLLTSQLQATDARKTFPCMDEPALKATFNITIERRTTKESKSNMEIISSETLSDGWVADRYDKTPVMSTYLLAFLVSDFECVSNVTKTGKLVEICARPPAKNQTEFAMSIAVDMQDWFEEYHLLEYPLPKTTHVAVPDFSAGAMENWGLIVYRETALLYDPETSSAANKQRVAVVVSHELAHQWFGNIVTPEWWDDVWLNEGFASYMELWGIHFVKDFKTWQMEEQFVVEDLQDVMVEDSLASSHPIYLTVNDPAEIGELFDGITYSKGASVIRMMKYFLGEQTFRMGLSNFLKNNTYQAAGHTDLFEFLSVQSEINGNKLDVDSIMSTWIDQMGYPVVTFSYSSADNSITVTQEHFLLDPTVNVTVQSPYNYIWQVPISYMTDVSGDPDLNNLTIEWLNTKEKKINTGAAPLDWIIGNVGETFYYRVNYDINNWNKLINKLSTNHQSILVTNRAQIIDDAFNLGRSGYIDQLIAFRATTYMTAETDYTPWYALSANMAYVRKMLSQTEGKTLLQAYMRKQFGNLYTSLGWKESPNEPHLNQRKRTIIVSVACRYLEPDCLMTANQTFSDWMQAELNNKSQPIDPNIASTVYCYGISEGGADEWNFAYQMFLKSNSGSQKNALLVAMGCSKQSWILQRYLQWALAEGEFGISRQDMSRVLVNVARNPIGTHIAWNFFKANWDIYFERFGDVTFTLPSMVTGMTESFSSDWELRDLERFIQQNPEQGTGSRAFQKAVESTKANIKWRGNNEHKIIDWLKKN